MADGKMEMCRKMMGKEIPGLQEQGLKQELF
jgi:hypothetical protein